MSKHTQIICQLLPTNCLSVLDHFVGLAFKRLKQWFPRCKVLRPLSYSILWRLFLIVRFGLLNLPITKYGKDCSRGSCKGIKISKSCCYIYVLVVMVTVLRSFSSVKNAVLTVSYHWPAAISNATQEPKGLNEIMCFSHFFGITLFSKSFRLSKVHF